MKKLIGTLFILSLLTLTGCRAFVHAEKIDFVTVSFGCETRSAYYYYEPEGLMEKIYSYTLEAHYTGDADYASSIDSSYKNISQTFDGEGNGGEDAYNALLAYHPELLEGPWTFTLTTSFSSNDTVHLYRASVTKEITSEDAQINFVLAVTDDANVSSEQKYGTLIAQITFPAGKATSYVYSLKDFLFDEVHNSGTVNISDTTTSFDVKNSTNADFTLPAGIYYLSFTFYGGTTRLNDY